MVGAKSGRGFYQKSRDEILTLDPKTLEYRAKQSAKLPSLEAAKSIEPVADRIRALYNGKDKAGAFLRATLGPTLEYSARIAGDVADSPADIDNAMKWGFGWEIGPFETAAALGTAAAAVNAQPPTPKNELSTSNSQLLRTASARVVKKNAGASLVDLGDGVLGIEFHSKMNAIGGDTIQMLQAGVKEASRNFAAVVVANDAPHFSAGANLMLLLLEAQEGNWDEVDMQTAEEFVDKEVTPQTDRLEQKDWALARTFVQRAGELGLLATDVPDEFGGLDLDKRSSIVVGEAIGRSASLATTFGAQTGLAITPILGFGTQAQKEKYLPRLVSGEIVGAYALSESGSGSDALGARARATRQADGSFVLNGEKMWITNGGFADLFIVFAKVDGEQFTGFIVERSFPGVSSGKEEHKLGLLGSSTTPLILQDARVPAENVLGEIGKGHKVAFNVLNYGRFKLAAM